MMMNSRQHLSLDEFGTTLDTFGADLARWPLPKRTAAEALLAENAAARRALADARVFDALLDRAPASDDARLQGLANRIVSAAVQLPSGVDTGSKDADSPATNVIPLRRRVEPAPVVARSFQRRNFGAAAVLAASLAMGVMIGVMDLMPGSLNQFATQSDAGPDVEQSVAATHADDLSDMLDEDQQ
jgi:hypothetical protein